MSRRATMRRRYPYNDMKITDMKYSHHALREAVHGFCGSRIVGWLLLVAAATRLAAQPVVTTITGGPSQTSPKFYGYIDGNTKDSAQFHTPMGLALDNSGSFLVVADRDNNAI